MLIKLFSSDLFVLLLTVIICLVLVGGLLVAIFYRPREYNNSHFSVFINILGSLGILIWALESMIFAASNQIEFDRNLRDNYDRTINNIFIQPFQLLTDEKIRPEFAASFNYSDLDLFNHTKDLSSDLTPQIILRENFVFHTIAQGFEDLLMLPKIEKNLDRIRIAILLEYSHSRFFQSKWKLFKLKYDETTQDFINLLISYSNQIAIPVKDPQLYVEKADLLLQDPQFNHIIAKVTS
jgi:hypothetical protein